MSDMRRKIQTIQSSTITLDQKRYLMQQVLTENYTKTRGVKYQFIPKNSDGSDSPSSPKSDLLPAPASTSYARDLGFGISALETLKSWTGLEEQAPIHFTHDDAQPTYRPLSYARLSDAFLDNAEDGPDSGEEIVPELGCVHYKRNVRVQCAECDKWYTCRLCHDEVEEHILPRRLTKHMLCMLCGHAQKASDTCTHCGESAASYYCTICKLWSDDVNKHIYHCDDCGICRVGRGLEKDFFHCKTCCACISIATKDDHKCLERATEANCPICNDIMFSSPQKVIFMDCGHPIHQACFDEYMNTSYKCPLCSKSIVKMDALFLNLANIIKEQPMPEEYRDVRSILFCNDCSAKSSTDYHFLGLRCQICQSFNTVELDRSPMPADANGSQEGTAATAAAAEATRPTNSRTVSSADHADSSSFPFYSPELRGSDRFSLGPSSPTRNMQYAQPEPLLDEGDQEEELDSWGRNLRVEDSSDDDESEDGDLDSELDEDDDDDEDEEEEEDEVGYEQGAYNLRINLLGHR
ncbi:zinc-ribbon-domain-containing protein [Coniella lustricola]|uniref:Zinc-ribbon-domain-containing protein n=1 Tax=Coniella lustricola TaxID=2025994 RepID=A0A2T2ZZW3_9PEZI|nr:zinc-ribbon-domain-containing protein [Coniella lustricola]